MSINNVAVSFRLEGALDAARVLAAPRARSRDAFVYLDLSGLLARDLVARFPLTRLFLRVRLWITFSIFRDIALTYLWVRFGLFLSNARVRITFSLS